MQSSDEKIDPRWGVSHPMHDPYVLANFQPRPTDVLITTPPKAGTTWMQQILHQLRTAGDNSFSSIDDVVPWLEIKRKDKSWQQVLQYYETLAEPRIFKTHCTAEQTPGIGTASIILSSRDPRDCCVSFYHHIMNMTDEALLKAEMLRPESFEQYVEQWLEYASWYRNVKSWWPFYGQPKVLWLRYQDMKSNLSITVESIANFLQWELAEEQKNIVLDYSSFEWMQAHDEKFSSQGNNGKPVFKPGKFVREGKVGGYSDIMTADQEQRILNKAHELLEPDCLYFLELDTAGKS
jgi:hypothetical protein